MFDKSFRPLHHVINCDYCDYTHVPFRFRQKMRSIQSLLIGIRNLSKCDYKLCMFDDGCVLLDSLRNKILWKFDYYSSLGILFARLEELKRFYNYEKTDNFNKNIISRNDYLALKHKYYGC